MHQPSQAQFSGAIRVTRAAPAVAWRARAGIILSAMDAMLRLPSRILAIRRDMALLGGMGDRELADIGLCRQDLRDATALGFGEHPGRLLGDRAAGRRRQRARDRLR